MPGKAVIANDAAGTRGRRESVRRLCRHNDLRAENIETARKLLGAMPVKPADEAKTVDGSDDLPPCPCCGSRLRIIETFVRGETPKHRPSPCPPVIRIDTS